MPTTNEPVEAPSANTEQPQVPALSPLRWKRLIALDFDDTIVAQNTDLVARDLLDPAAITDDHRRLYSTNGWTDYMQAIFCTLHENGFDSAAIRDAIRAIPEVPGMVALVATLVQQHEFDAIIISDSNSEFIDQWSEANGLAEHVLRVFTNPAAFDGDGVLRIRPHHQQTECALSTVNLCKGRVLEEFLRERHADAVQPVAYGQVYYVGDGRNDLCPTLRLSRVDLCCPRIGFWLEKEMKKRAAAAAEGGDLQCGLLDWANGEQLLDVIQQKVRQFELARGLGAALEWYGGCESGALQCYGGAELETRKKAVGNGLKGISSE